MLFRARQFEFIFPRPALVMGVVNVTPDSFSDGGKFFDVSAAVEHGLKLAAEGAEILDIGGESTRPRATPVSEAEELRRVIPVIEQLAARVKIPISIDTMKPAVARAAIGAGASIVNDIAASREDDAMARVIADSGAGYVLMHMQGTPQTMHVNPVYADVTREVGEFFSRKIQRLSDCGIAREQVIVDVGIGFGKTLEHNLLLLGALRSFTKLERPLVLGVSRKSFIGKLLGAETPDRLPAALACAALAVETGVQIVRTHDVAETLQAIRMTEAILAHSK
ncbi:MAG TPA: dihydropteroate synthase [Verrucomicrobiae bacterium]|jgi:dihydropteroate synthase|nr:dihydropteroate synthase [Verrucomicrobiae bacterium]